MQEQDKSSQMEKENRRLVRKLRICREQVAQYQKYFLGQGVLLQEDLDREIREAFPSSEENFRTVDEQAPAYDYWKRWLFSRNWELDKQEILAILEKLSEGEQTGEFPNSQQIRDKTEKLWGKEGPSKAQREHIQSAALFFSLLQAVWANDF